MVEAVVDAGVTETAVVKPHEAEVPDVPARAIMAEAVGDGTVDDGGTDHAPDAVDDGPIADPHRHHARQHPINEVQAAAEAGDEVPPIAAERRAVTIDRDAIAVGEAARAEAIGAGDDAEAEPVMAEGPAAAIGEAVSEDPVVDAAVVEAGMMVAAVSTLPISFEILSISPASAKRRSRIHTGCAGLTSAASDLREAAKRSLKA